MIALAAGCIAAGLLPADPTYAVIVAFGAGLLAIAVGAARIGAGR